MKLIRSTIILALAAGVIGTQADVVSATYNARHVIQGNFQTGSGNTFAVDNNNGRRMGAGGSGTAQRVNVPVVEFALPTLTGGTTISGADLSVSWENTAITSGLNFDGIVTLMNYDATTDFSGADFNDDVSNLGNGSLAGTFTSASVTGGGTVNVSLGAPALALLESFYTGANPNQASVFFRLSLDGTHEWPANANDRYNILTADGTSNGDLVTSFSIQAVPEPATLGLLGVFGGGILFVRRRFTT